jgi:hypothetical protein
MPSEGLFDPKIAKRCTRCRTVKPRAQFSRRTASPDGLKPECKPCCLRRKQIAAGRGVRPSQIFNSTSGKEPSYG